MTDIIAMFDRNQAWERAADLADLCVSAGVPEMMTDLIRSGASVDDVRERVERIGGITQLCRAAGCADYITQRYTKAGFTVERARADLVGFLTGVGEEDSARRVELVAAGIPCLVAARTGERQTNLQTRG